jgi:AcrR family transcriptional regulator
MSGRQAQAARNDGIIMQAARDVFVADPHAPIAAVAARAGVGISALYRRYPSKEDLLRRLCRDGLVRYIAAAEAALADERDPWGAFAAFMAAIVEADTPSLTLKLAGTFTPDEDLYRESQRAEELNVKLFARTQAAGALRPDLAVDDLGLLLQQLAAVRVTDPARTAALRRRYLALMLDALRTPTPSPLPGPAPTWEEMQSVWSVPGP